MPRASCEAAATFSTASANGTCAGSAARASAVGTSSAGITTIASTPSGGSRRTGAGSPPSSGLGQSDEAAVDCRCDVVGMALDRDRALVDLLAAECQLVHVVGRHQARDDRRGARAEAARERDLRSHLEMDAVGRVEVLEGADAEVRAVARKLVLTGVDCELLGLPHLELELKSNRGREHVEAGPKVGRGRGHADEAPAERHQPEPAREPDRPAMALTR